MEIGHNEDATMYTNEFENNNSSNNQGSNGKSGIVVVEEYA